MEVVLKFSLPYAEERWELLHKPCARRLGHAPPAPLGGRRECELSWRANPERSRSTTTLLAWTTVGIAPVHISKPPSTRISQGRKWRPLRVGTETSQSNLTQFEIMGQPCPTKPESAKAHVGPARERTGGARIGFPSLGGTPVRDSDRHGASRLSALIAGADGVRTWVRIFSGVVRLHRDALANRAAASVGARAFNHRATRIVLERRKSRGTPTYSGTKPTTCCSKRGRRRWRNYTAARPCAGAEAQPEPRWLQGGHFIMCRVAPNPDAQRADVGLGEQSLGPVGKNTRLSWCRSSKRPRRSF